VSLAVPRRAFDTRPPRPGPPRFIAGRRGRASVRVVVVRGMDYWDSATPVVPPAAAPIPAPPPPVAVAPIVRLVSAVRGPDPAPVPKPKRPTVKGWKSKKQRLRHGDTQ
jgi:hypothetical protein